jgi:hypothetical protein
MALFWLVHEIDRPRVVRIQEDGAMIFARLHAMIDGFGGVFIEAHLLDAKTAKRIPRKMIGRTLSTAEATGLLERIV